MGFARTCSVALVGVEGVVVEVQADLEPGVAAFTLVGLPDKSLTESRDRVRAAVVNSGGELAAEEAHRGTQPGIGAQERAAASTWPSRAPSSAPPSGSIRGCSPTS